MNGARSPKSLLGVAHDIAEHAQSGLSFLYPHLCRACQEAGVRTTSLSLLEDDPYPATLRQHEPLALAFVGVRLRFLQILASYGYSSADVASIQLSFTFPVTWEDGSIYAVVAAITTPSGRVFEKTLKYDGYAW
jgi:hypothetical protein